MSLDSRLKMCYSEGSGTCSLDLALDLVALATSTGAPMLDLIKYCKKISTRVTDTGTTTTECVGRTQHKKTSTWSSRNQKEYSRNYITGTMKYDKL